MLNQKVVMAHYQACQLFKLEPAAVIDQQWHNEWGWAIRPVKMAMRDLGDRLLVSAIFSDDETGENDMQNLSVIIKNENDPMVFNGCVCYQAQVQIELDAAT